MAIVQNEHVKNWREIFDFFIFVNILLYLTPHVDNKKSNVKARINSMPEGTDQKSQHRSSGISHSSFLKVSIETPS